MEERDRSDTPVQLAHGRAGLPWHHSRCLLRRSRIAKFRTQF